MINVTLQCSPNPPSELVTSYKFYDKGQFLDEVPVAALLLEDVAPGSHIYTASGVNILGEGPLSDSVEVNLPQTKPGKVLNLTVMLSVV